MNIDEAQARKDLGEAARHWEFQIKHVRNLSIGDLVLVHGRPMEVIAKGGQQGSGPSPTIWAIAFKGETNIKLYDDREGTETLLRVVVSFRG